MPPSHHPDPSAAMAARKTALRDQVVTARNRLTPAAIGDAAQAIADHLLATTELRRAITVACYISVGTEPGTAHLIDTMTGAGQRVILPVVRPEGLDWAPYDGPRSIASARWGLLEPVTPTIGPDAVATADVVLLPGLAVSPTGMRLGKGRAYYDGALARVPAGTFTCVLLYDGETGRDVPVEDHDQSVAAACTPSGLVRFR